MDHPEWVIAFQSADDDESNTHPCPEGLVKRVLGLMSEGLRVYFSDRLASPLPVSLNQVLTARRLILKQVDQLAAHGYINWPDGSQSTPTRIQIGDISPFLLDLVRRPAEEMSVDDIAGLSSRLTLQARRMGIVSLKTLIPETADTFLREALQLVVKLKGRPGLRRTLEGQLAATKLSAQLGKTYQLIIEGLVSTQCGESPRYVARIVRETDSQGDAQRPSRDEIRPTNERSDLNSMAEESQLGKELDFIADLLGQFLGKEDPKTVAGILSRLDTTLTAVFGRLPKAIHGEVVYHLFQLREGPLGLLRWTAQDLGGIEAVAKILNKSTNSIVKQVLDYVDQKDPRLAEQIRNQMFTFEDIARMPDRDIRQLLEQVDYRDMGLALRGVSEKVTSRFLSNMSDSDPLNMTASAKTLVQKQMASSGPVRVLDVEDAQLRIVQQMRQLEEIGRVTIVRGDGDKIL